MAIVNVTKELGNRLGGFEKYLYEEILLLCESKEILQLKNDVNAPEYLNHKALYGDVLIYNHQPETGKFKLTRKSKNSPDKELYIDVAFASQDITDKIIFTAKQNKTFKSLFSHIRNAFAHNLITIETDANKVDYVMMCDFLNGDSTKPTMVGYIKKNTLVQLINTLKNIK